MKKVTLVLLIAFTVSLTLWGCGENQTKNEENKRQDSYNLVFVCPAVNNPYWQECIRGIRQADAELGTTTEILGPETLDNYKEDLLKSMKRAVGEKPDGIMGYMGVPGMDKYIKEADNQGIPVVAVDSDAEDTSRTAYVGTDLYRMGYDSGIKMVELTGGKGKIGYMCTTFDAEGEKKVYQAFCDAIMDYDMEVVAETEGYSDIAKAEAAAEKMLEEHPEITAVFCSGGYNITGVGNVKKDKGLSDLCIIGMDDVSENIALVKAGVIDALFVQRTYDMGYQGVYILKNIIDEETMEYSNFDTGTICVTKENVNSYK